MAVMMVTNGLSGLNIIGAELFFSQTATVRSPAGLRKVARVSCFTPFCRRRGKFSTPGEL
jgi:hypothetical protein